MLWAVLYHVPSLKQFLGTVQEIHTQKSSSCFKQTTLAPYLDLTLDSEVEGFIPHWIVGVSHSFSAWPFTRRSRQPQGHVAISLAYWGWRGRGKTIANVAKAAVLQDTGKVTAATGTNNKHKLFKNRYIWCNVALLKIPFWEEKSTDHKTN